MSNGVKWYTPDIYENPVYVPEEMEQVTEDTTAHVVETPSTKRVLTAEQFEKLCGIQCTLPEMAAFFGYSEDTVERWAEREYGMKFAEVFSQKRGKGRVSLRRMQWQTAASGNPTMQIFLGKQYLNQREPTRHEIGLVTHDPESNEKYGELNQEKLLEIVLKEQKIQGI
jgi:hypothetical protein